VAQLKHGAASWYVVCMAGQRLNQLKEELTSVREAISALYTNGQEHTLTGSHAFKGVSYEQLLRREREILSEIVSLSGGSQFTLPDYS